jgi:hypothetical protein
MRSMASIMSAKRRIDDRSAIRALSGKKVETGFPKRSCSTKKLEQQSIQSEAIVL